MPAAPELPRLVPPMLAKSSSPFDSEKFLFEIKWDGARAIAYSEDSRYRLLNRRRRDMVERYPELAYLAELEPGVILDGEIVVLRDGKPDFHGMLKREQAHSPTAIRHLARKLPATYVVFDLLYRGFEPITSRPLEERREALEELVTATSDARLVFSGGIVGGGQAYFDKACEQELEGVIAKRLGSRYLPGRRTDAWLKIKRSETVLCAIIGFVPGGEGDFRSLIVAVNEEGTLRCVGRVGSGIDDRLRERLAPVLHARIIDEPIVPVTLKGKWVEPGLYCRVSYLERTPGGELRAPVFKGLIEDG